jgi:hypothetical protein
MVFLCWLLIRILFPVWKTHNLQKRGRAIQKVSRKKGEKTLYKIAINAPLADVRSAAVIKLKNQELLAEIAKNNSMPRVREVALDQLTNQAFIFSVIMSRGDGSAALAVKKLADPEVCLQIAQTHKNWEVRRAAYEQVGDQFHVNAEILLYSPAQNARKDAVRGVISLGNRDNLPAVISQLLEKTNQDDKVAITFLLETASKEPDVLRGLWPTITAWANRVHADSIVHEDIKPDLPHADSVQYYDFYRRPDGITYPNKGGRKKHTDQSIMSDCSTYDHTDNKNVHKDNGMKDLLERFPASIRGE